MNRRRFFSFLGASATALAAMPLIGRLFAQKHAFDPNKQYAVLFNFDSQDQGHYISPNYREIQHQKSLMFKGLMDQL